jgi:hypothetical protein
VAFSWPFGRRGLGLVGDRADTYIQAGPVALPWWHGGTVAPAPAEDRDLDRAREARSPHARTPARRSRGFACLRPFRRCLRAPRSKSRSLKIRKYQQIKNQINQSESQTGLLPPYHTPERNNTITTYVQYRA